MGSGPNTLRNTLLLTGALLAASCSGPSGEQEQSRPDRTTATSAVPSTEGSTTTEPDLHYFPPLADRAIPYDVNDRFWVDRESDTPYDARCIIGMSHLLNVLDGVVMVDTLEPTFGTDCSQGDRIDPSSLPTNYETILEGARAKWDQLLTDVYGVKVDGVNESIGIANDNSRFSTVGRVMMTDGQPVVELFGGKDSNNDLVDDRKYGPEECTIEPGRSIQFLGAVGYKGQEYSVGVTLGSSSTTNYCEAGDMILVPPDREHPEGETEGPTTSTTVI